MKQSKNNKINNTVEKKIKAIKKGVEYYKNTDQNKI